MRRAGLYACLLLCGTADATAQGVAGLDSVRSMSTPNSEPRGIRAGPVVTYLSVGLRGQYNDNIHAADSNPKADYVAHIRPRLEVRTRRRRHGARATLEADAARHLRNPAADAVAYGGRVTAHLDLDRTTRVGVTLAAQREYEDPAAPDAPGGETRTPIRRYAARLEADTRLGRLGAAAAGGVERLNFGDVAPDNQASEGENDDRDRSSARVAARLSYGLSAVYEPFIQGAYNVVDYDRHRDASGFDRDSRGFTLGAGLRYRPNGFTVAETRVGYRKQSTAAARLGPVEGLTAEIALRSNLTPHTTLDVSAQRLLRQTTADNASGFFATRGRARIDQRLWHNLFLGANAAFARHTFVSALGEREDRLFSARVDARYDPSAFLRLTADYRYTRRVSNRDAGFARNQVTLGAELRY